MTIPIGLSPILQARIYSGDRQTVEDIGDMFTDFEWSSFINNGYRVRVRVLDSLYNRIHKLATEFYLDQSRSIPIPITFRILWSNASKEFATPEFTAYITSIMGDGVPNSGYVEFIAIDPPGFVLSHVSSGKAYRGNISSVVRQVIKNANDAVFSKAPEDPNGEKPGIKWEVTETTDDKNGIWHQMRMDSSTFIKSLLEWSSSLTKDKTQWIVASGQKQDKDSGISKPYIFIKQWAELKKNLNSENNLLGTIAFNSSGSSDVVDFKFMGDNFVGVSQSRLETMGISTCSGLYVDPSYIEKGDRKAQVDDTRTTKKLNVDIDPARAYTKPAESELGLRSSSIIAVPEFSGGEVGVKYQDYIDGRARGIYHKTIGSIMRIKLTVNGWHKIWDSTILGATVVNVSWKDNDEQNYFLSGDWILYGFKHRVSRKNWFTDLYLTRIDHDAKSDKVPNQNITVSR